MVGRVVTRVLAAGAIIAVVVVVYVIVHAAINKDHHAHHHHHHGATASAGHHHRHKHRDHSQFYVVKPGDTLSQIAARTHHSLIRLEHLNPNISPNALQTGLRLRLRK